MQAVKSDRSLAQPTSANKITPIVFILVVLSIIGLYAENAYQAFHPATLPQGTVILSQNAFEQKYGLHVNLLAVTAAGGFVDVRLKMVDGDKVKLLLADKKNFPSLVTQKGTVLTAPADTISQPIEYISGGNLFIMYPNSGNAIQRGDSVTILFGGIALEPIEAK